MAANLQELILAEPYAPDPRPAPKVQRHDVSVSNQADEAKGLPKRCRTPLKVCYRLNRISSLDSCF